MKRRDVIRSVAASGIVSIAAGTAAGLQTGPGGPMRAPDLDSLRVVRDGDVVRTVVDPDEAQIDRLFDDLAENESLVTPEECCYYECKSQCAYCDYPPGCTDNCCCDWRDDSC